MLLLLLLLLLLLPQLLLHFCPSQLPPLSHAALRLPTLPTCFQPASNLLPTCF